MRERLLAVTYDQAKLAEWNALTARMRLEGDRDWLVHRREAIRPYTYDHRPLDVLGGCDSDVTFVYKPMNDRLRAVCERAREWLRQVVNHEVYVIVAESKTKYAGWYGDWYIGLNALHAYTPTVVHEVGHHIEQFWIEDALELQDALKGQPVPSSYMRKRYGYDGTEVTSVLLTELYKNPRRLASKFPHLFDWLIERIKDVA